MNRKYVYMYGASIGLLLVAATAFAQAKARPLLEELSGQGRTSFEQGKELFEGGDYATARAKFKESYNYSKNPRLLWNMAACSARMQHYVDAIVEAERYLAEGQGKLVKDQTDTANGSLAEWRTLVATATITVTPSGAELRIDDEPRGIVNAPTAIFLDMGKHEFHLEKAGYEPLTQTVNVREIGKISYAFTLKPVAMVAARLVVNTDLEATIELDGRPMGKGLFEGTVAPGAHRLRVSAPGKVPFESLVEATIGATKQLTVSLSAERSPLLGAVQASTAPNAEPRAEEKQGSAWWPWAVGGAVLAAGAGVGAYYLFKPEEPGALRGTVATVELR
jgi:hypothetical protein